MRKSVLVRERRACRARSWKTFLDSVTVDIMKKWRAVHLPITAIFGVLALLHILSILVFWRW